MRTAIDSITGAGVLAGFAAMPWANVVMGYDDGNWPDANTLAQMFPGRTIVRITTNPNDNEGDMLDVETGDARPGDAPGWTTRRRQAGHGGPLTYFPDSWRQQILNAYSAQNVTLPGLFPAAYPGGGPILINPATDVGHQYASTDQYDASVVVDHLPGIDPSPAPTPPKPWEASMPCSPLFTFKTGQEDCFQVASGGLNHKFIQGGNTLHTETLASGLGGTTNVVATFPDQIPGVSVIGGAINVIVEDSNGHVHQFQQAVNSNSFGHNLFP